MAAIAFSQQMNDSPVAPIPAHTAASNTLPGSAIAQTGAAGTGTVQPVLSQMSAGTQQQLPASQT